MKSNTQTNSLLKTTGEKVGIKQAVKITEVVDGKKKSVVHRKYELITFHTIRRTFITIAKKLGIRRDIAKAMTSHKDERTYS